jgi:hypothetical protein
MSAQTPVIRPARSVPRCYSTGLNACAGCELEDEEDACNAERIRVGLEPERPLATVTEIKEGDD